MPRTLRSLLLFDFDFPEDEAEADLFRESSVRFDLLDLGSSGTICSLTDKTLDIVFRFLFGWNELARPVTGWMFSFSLVGERICSAALLEDVGSGLSTLRTDASRLVEDDVERSGESMKTEKARRDIGDIEEM